MFIPLFMTYFVLVLSGMTAVDTVAQADEIQPIARARTLLKLLVGREYDDFVASGDDTMRAAFSAQQAQQFWELFESQHGPYQAEESAEVTPIKGYHSVRFTLRFERARQQIRLVLDQQGRLAGLWRDQSESIAAYIPPSYVDRKSFREEQISVSAGKYPLAGTLTIPTGQGPYPGVVLVHGSGPHDQDETVGAQKPFRDLAWGLASRGIAVVRYEKRTKAHPTAKEPTEWTLADTTIEDAVAAAKLLRKHPAINAQQVFIAGHSLGGLAAPYIAQQDDALAGIVVLAGSARSILDLLEEQTTYLAELEDGISAEERKRIDELKRMTAAIRAGRLEDVPTVHGMPATFMAELHGLNPPMAAAQLDLRILILQGGRDYQVTRADYALWKKYLNGHKNVTFKLFDELNHLFSAGKGSSKPEEYQQPGHVDQSVIDTIAGWIKRD